jgi:hypothetical protein
MCGWKARSSTSIIPFPYMNNMRPTYILSLALGLLCILLPLSGHEGQGTRGTAICEAASTEAGTRETEIRGAQARETEIREAQSRKTACLPQGAYLSINPLSLLAFVPSVPTKEILPYAHGLESGLSLAGGYYFRRIQLEGRVVAGSPAALIFCPQLHAGVRWFPFVREDRSLPVGVGVFIRGWDSYYTHSGIHFFNTAPQLQLAYVYKRNRLFFDFRIGWDLAVLTWSNLEHSTADLNYSGVPPAVSINIGYSF